MAGTAEIEKDGHRNDFTEVGGTKRFHGNQGVNRLGVVTADPVRKPKGCQDRTQ